MKDRIKWILVGVGFTFGLQVIISLIYTGIAFSAARSETGVPQDSISVLVIGIALGAFLIGGFIVGWMSEELRIVEALIVAILTLVLSALIYTVLPEGNKAQFLTGLLVGDMARHAGLSVVFIILALVAAAVGNYMGWHVKVPQEGVIDRVALLIGLIGAVVGPFALLALGGRNTGNQPELPWYFLVIVLVLLLVIVGVGFVMFTRESHYDEEISISPETRREQQ
jgi:MFS family permease